MSTGGGGEQFETAVGAYGLGLVLMRATPPVLLDTGLVEVSFQTRYLGWRTDDILFVGEVRPGDRRLLAMQAKRAFRVSARDEDCVETIRAMWADFTTPELFDPSRDRLAVATLHGTATLLHDFRSLLDAARDATDARDFRRRRDTYLSQKACDQYEAVATILAALPGGGPSEEQLWSFLRVVHVLVFDLGTSTAQHEAHLLSLLAHMAVGVDDPRAAAGETWRALLEVAADGRQSARVYRRETLPEALRARHSGIATADARAFADLVEHGHTVRRGIRGLVGGVFEIDRSARVARIIEQLDQHTVVVVAGAAGSGKSALAARAATLLERERPVLAFHAVELARAHINETLARTQTDLTEAALLAQLASHDRTTILVDGVERLLERDVRDAFWHLLLAAKRTPGVRLLLTCRDYSLETVRSSLIVPAGVGHAVSVVPDLSDAELDAVAAGVPRLAPALADARLRKLMRTPYVLDMASRLDWDVGALPANARAFREKCWCELVREDRRPADGMPRRRELAFVDVARRRAADLRPFVTPSTHDYEALDALERASLLARAAPTRQLYAPAHDVLEDWAVLHWLDELADGAGDDPALVAQAMARAVGGLPALRRGFKRWLGERLELDPAAATEFVLAAMGDGSLAQHFRDDCAVSALSSEAAPAFVAGCGARVAWGDRALLHRMIHLLRVACKALPPWLPRGVLPSIMLVPDGPAWPPVLALAANTPPASFEEVLLYLGFAEDWAGAVSVWTPDPPGAADAGRLLAQLLPHLVDSYRLDDPRKRALQTMLKIPRHVPGFAELMARARAPRSEDRAARDMSELVATTPWSAFACRDMPDEVIAVVRARLLIADARRDLGSHSAIDVSSSFGIRERGVSEFFPASAIQGPFQALLREHPAKGLDSILELLNHAGAWYGERRWRGFNLEPAVRVTLDVPGAGRVEQWMNGRLFVLYRGYSVGPEVVKSALMALEAWLLRRAQDGGENLEPVLLDILARSNNVMATGVVASVCVAAPERVGRAPLALLSCAEVVLADRARMSHDYMGSHRIMGGLSDHALHDDERKTSDALPHRREDLQQLAVRLQQTDLRDEVWAVIDRQRAELGDAAADDETSRVWRLALHRMDLRSYRVVDAPPGAITETDDGRQLLYIEPALEPDLRQMVDESAESFASMNRYLRLQNVAHALWKDRAAPEAAQWRTFLAEARALASEGPAPSPYFEGFAAGIAAVCVRDYRAELDEDERAWCVGRIEAELAEGADAWDDFTGRARGVAAGEGPAAVAALVVADAPDALVGDADAFLARTLTHAARNVADVAYQGAAAFLGPEHRLLLLRCAAAAAAAAKEADEAMEAEWRQERLAGLATAGVAGAARAAALAALRLDEQAASSALAELNFDSWTGADAAVRIALLLERRPDWPEATAFFSCAASWLAAVWDDRRERRRAREYGQRERHYEAEAALAQILARFVLRQPADAARATCAPLVRQVPNDAREVATFVQHLIGAADGSTDDSFWEVWQAFADAVVAAPWTGNLHGERPYESSLVDAIFLGTWWKQGIRHWVRLDGHETRVPDLARRLPAAPACAHGFLRYLSTIGQRSLPQALIRLNEVVARGDATAIFTYGDSTYRLETLLGRYVYAQPHRLKSDAALRRAVLALLDGLVETGSSAAYRMRDDFVTPPSTRGDGSDAAAVAVPRATIAAV